MIIQSSICKMDEKHIIYSLFSHFDKNIYSVQEVTELALKCKNEGAETVHLHIEKVGGINNFIHFLRLLEENDGPFVCLSVSDYRQYMDSVSTKSSRVHSASIIGADCTVFGKKISTDFNKLVEGVSEYIQRGLFPEVCIFNLKGIENCIKLNSIFPKKFYVGVYMGYPEQMDSSVENIKKISKELRDCSYVSYTIYHELTKTQIDAILTEKGYIRCGMEDQDSICGVMLENPIVGIRTVNKAIENSTVENEKAFVQNTKKHFNKVYTCGDDNNQLCELINLLCVENNTNYLDLGTGSGYVAFGIAEKYPLANVVGLDIVEEMQARNQDEATKRGVKNISFLCYDGIRFPVSDSCFDGIIARYSLHHFPNIERTIKEMDRVLKSHSKIVICDCISTINDNNGFLDRWMQVLGDGHVSFRSVEEYQRLFEKYGYELKSSSFSSIMCPRNNNEIYSRLLYENIMIAESYHYQIDKNNVIWLKLPVVHLYFAK